LETPQYRTFWQKSPKFINKNEVFSTYPTQKFISAKNSFVQIFPKLQKPGQSSIKLHYDFLLVYVALILVNPRYNPQNFYTDVVCM